MSATAALGRFVAGSRWDDLPAALRPASGAFLAAVKAVPGVAWAQSVVVRGKPLLNALWLTLNVVFLVPYVRDGLVSAASVRQSLALSPALVVGIVAGEAAHRRIAQKLFRKGVYVMLLGAGAMLVARG